MRLLFDECLPRRLKRHFVGHQVLTVPEAGLAGVANLRFQQNLSGLAFGILVLRAVSNDMSDLLPLVPAAVAALETIQPGTVVEIGGE